MMAAGPTVVALEGYNQGVGGDTIQDVLDRMATIAAAITPGCIVDIQIGTNDISTQSGDADYFKAKVETFCQLALDYGARHVRINPIPAPTGRSGDPITYEQWLAQRALHNAALASISLPNTSFAHNVLDVVMLSSDYVDDTHPSPDGAVKLGLAEGAWLGNYQRTLLQGYLADNLITNAALSGTSGTLTGSGNPTGNAPDGWTVAITTATGCTVDIEADAIDLGANALKITIPAQTIGGNAVIQLRRDVTVPSTLASDVYLGAIQYKIEAGHAGIRNMDLSATNSFQSPEESRTPDAMIGGEALGGVLCTVQESAVSAGLTTIQFAATYRLEAGNVSGVVYFSKPVFRKRD
jgi:lysophospholipase L1-like esterase